MLSRASQTALESPKPRSFVREAAAEFVRGTARGWDRRDLASWLLCHYAPCLAADAAVHPDARSSAVPPALVSKTPAFPRLDDDHIEQLVLDARCKVLHLLGDLSWPSQARRVADKAIAGGVVMKQRGPSGVMVWAPVGRARMRLADRASSLFVADSLNAPTDYRQISLCRHCSEIGFSGPVEHEPSCDRAVRCVA